MHLKYINRNNQKKNAAVVKEFVPAGADWGHSRKWIDYA